MGTPYRECPNCGAHLDAGEPCDCTHKERDPRPAAEPEKPLQRMRLTTPTTGRIFPRIPLNGPKMAPPSF